MGLTEKLRTRFFPIAYRYAEWKGWPVLGMTLAAQKGSLVVVVRSGHADGPEAWHFVPLAVLDAWAREHHN